VNTEEQIRNELIQLRNKQDSFIQQLNALTVDNAALAETNKTYLAIAKYIGVTVIAAVVAAIIGLVIKLI